MIAFINMLSMIGIDCQMIAKDKTWTLLYKDFLLSHSVSLGDKQRIKVEGIDILWFRGIFNIISLCLVCRKAFLY